MRGHGPVWGRGTWGRGCPTGAGRGRPGATPPGHPPTEAGRGSGVRDRRLAGIWPLESTPPVLLD